MKLRLLWLIAGMMLVQVSWGQSDVHTLEKALKGQPMALRSYSADPVASYAWVDGKLEAAPVKLHTLGVFTTQSVKQKKDKIVFEGERATLVGDAQKSHVRPTVKVPMKIEVDLQGTDSAVVLPRLQEMLFFPDTTSAIAGLPEPVVEMLPFDAKGKPAAACYCDRVFDDGRWIRLNHPSSKYVAPKLVSMTEPGFSEEARRAKMSGSVTLVFYVSAGGRVGETWLATPLGAGFDEQAAIAARQYVFKPAQYEGRPVGTELSVEVNFQTF